MGAKTKQAARYGKKSGLTPQMELFVQAFIETGGRNATEAARLAGYTGGEQSINNAAYRLTHDPRILKRIAEEAEGKFRVDILLAQSAMSALLLDPMHKDHFKAIEATLDRGGLMKIAKLQVDHHIHDERPTGELLAAVKEIAGRLGVDATKLLGYDPTNVTDADFKEVEDEPEDDLSDLLGDLATEEDDDE